MKSIQQHAVLTSLHSENQLEKAECRWREDWQKGLPRKSEPVARQCRRVTSVTFGPVTNCSHLCPMDLSLMIFFIVLLLPPGSLGEKQLNEFSVFRVLVYYKFF